MLSCCHGYWLPFQHPTMLVWVGLWPPRPAKNTEHGGWFLSLSYYIKKNNKKTAKKSKLYIIYYRNELKTRKQSNTATNTKHISFPFQLEKAGKVFAIGDDEHGQCAGFGTGQAAKGASFMDWVGRSPFMKEYEICRTRKDYIGQNLFSF